jgi:transcriptional regulator with XRE-family HTH domain
MERNRFAVELDRRMKARRMRVGQLADATSVSSPRISQYLNCTHRPGEDMIEKIAAALDWPLQDALHCAGYHRPELDAGAAEIGAELADIIDPLEPDDRRLVLTQLREWARGLVGIMTETRGLTSKAGNRTHNSVLCVSFNRTARHFPAPLPDCCLPSRIPIHSVAA